MIGTHAPKMFNARLQQEAVRSRILGAPTNVVCSRNVAMERELWALPRNAAEMAMDRQAAEAATLDFELSIPGIEDPRVKQVLLPGERWRDGEYHAVSPLASCGVIHEVWRRVFDRKLPHKKWTVQPMAVALPNHGETLMRQSGSVALLRRALGRPQQHPLPPHQSTETNNASGL